MREELASVTLLAVSSLANTRLTRETETFLLPVFRLVDSSPDDFLHQILRVGTVDAIRIFNGSVCHRNEQ